MVDYVCCGLGSGVTNYFRISESSSPCSIGSTSLESNGATIYSMNFLTNLTPNDVNGLSVYGVAGDAGSSIMLN